jgi:acyl-CoA reductase-like NAD-dependent aldehyde dehydrogenase
MQRLDPDLSALQEVRDAVRRAVAAQAQIAEHSQEQVDRLCAAMAKAAAGAAADLARLAVEETGIGRAHYKVLKNLFASEGIWRSIEKERTVGIIRRDEQEGVIEIASPIGVVCGIVPTTNPTSTAIGKALIAVKGRNAIVISPHPRAKRCIFETVEVLRRALERVGAPGDLVQCLSNPTQESTQALMEHRDMKLILATGGSGLVQAAYSSGKPAYGVGPGNVPVYIDRSANLAEAAQWIVASQSFDNATLCCSEQALVLDRPIAKAMLAKLQERGAHLCTPEETRLLERHCNKGGHMNPEVVGADPWRVAEGAGFRVEPSTTLLLAHQGGVGKDWPLSIEILCPLLSVHEVDGWEQGCDVSLAILRHGGLGHTIGIWANDERVLNAWYLEKPASRIVVNGPTSQGAVGYSTGLKPSMSLGCGPLAGNITSDNITARHLINIKRVGLRKPDWQQQYERDMARAAELLGNRESAPRGSGLPGDPGLRGQAQSRPRPPEPLVEPASWRGNPASAATPATTSPRAAAPAPASPVPAAGGFSGPGFGSPVAPLRPAVSVAPGATSPGPRAPRPGDGQPLTPLRAGVAHQAASSPGSTGSSAASPAAGASASGPRPGPRPATIEQAVPVPSAAASGGAGCPLGPCRGCPHKHPTTNACTA